MMRRSLLVAAVFATLAAMPAAGAAESVPVAPGVPSHGRAWELVTPPGSVSARPTLAKAIAHSGNRIAYITSGSLPGATFGGLITYNMATRGPAGWANEPLAFPRIESVSALFEYDRPVAFDSELTTSIWMNALTSPSGVIEGRGLFRSQPGGGYTLLANMGDGQFRAGSGDLQRLVFSSPAHLLPADAARTEGSSLYELAGSSLRLVDVDDSGALLSACAANSFDRTGISRDGLRIFFASQVPCGSTQRIYLRANGETTEVSASQCTRPDCGPAQDVIFVGATPSGSEAFLVTGQQLTDGDEDENLDLYRYDVASGALSLLSTPKPPVLPAAQVDDEPVRVSDDGSRVYFLSFGSLVPGKGAESSPPSIYLADGGGLHFVTLSNQESDNRFEISRDGRYALFETPEALVAEDTDARADLYRYDALTEAYTLITAGPGDRGNGPFDVELPRSKAVSSHDFGVLSDDGRRVVFETAEQLVPQDGNEKADVYEWVDGDLGLVSAGTAGYPANLIGMTPDGGTVLFQTNATLLGRDRDAEDRDFYAARIGGGFAEPSVPPDCEEMGCEAAPRAPGARRPAAGAAGRPRIELAPIGVAARRQLLARGWTVLLAEVPAPGRLSARGEARIGSRQRTVAAGSVRATQAGAVRLRLRLTQAAQESLAAGVKLRVRLTLRLAGSRAVRQTSFVVGGGR
jgi:hypothetical protein